MTKSQCCQSDDKELEALPFGDLKEVGSFTATVTEGKPITPPPAGDEEIREIMKDIKHMEDVN